MSNLTDVKIEFCNDMVALLEGLDTETAEQFIQWLAKLGLVRAHFYEFWLEEAELIYCTED